MMLSLLTILLCASAQATFVDATDAAGLTMQHQPAPLHPIVMMTGGGTVGDFNGDSWPDVFVPSGGLTPDKLFINQGDGSFLEQAVAWGMTDLHYGTGSAAGDYNRDGTFSEVAAAANVNMPSVNYDNFSAAWGDYDRDGWLDLFVTAYAFGQGGNTLYHNNGDGTFQDVTAAVGMTGLDITRGLVPDFVDIDQDGDTDLFVIADTGTSVFFRNQGNQHFVKDNAAFSVLGSVNGMGIAIGDFDQDLRTDLYVSDIYYMVSGDGGNRLFLQESPGVWTEKSRIAGVSANGWGWGIAATDIDNDGLQDLVTTNGWSGAWDHYPTRIFHGLGYGAFEEVATQCGLLHSEQGRSMLRLDADRDGREDIIITASNGPLRYFHNETVNGNHWLQVAFDTSAHPGLAPHGMGATVYLRSGDRVLVRVMDSGQSYLGQGEWSLQFGLRNWDRVEELRVLWPDQSESLFFDLPADQRLVLRPSQPWITVSSLVAGQAAEFTVGNAAPNSNLLIAVSLVGLGPTHTRLGDLAVSTPFEVQTLWTGADGVAQFAAHVGLGLSGLGLWAQAYDPAGGFFSNALAETVY